MEKENITLKDLIGLINEKQIWKCEYCERREEAVSKIYSTKLDDDVELELGKFSWDRDTPPSYCIRTTFKGTILINFEYRVPRGKVDEPETKSKRIMKEKYDFVKKEYENQTNINNKINEKEGLEKLYQILGKR